MRPRVVFGLILAVAIVALQILFLVEKFAPFAPSPWVREPAELAQFGNLRIGVVRTIHGAQFVRLAIGEPALSRLQGDDAQEVESAMRQQLRSIPVKVVLEGVWYFLLIFGVIYLPIERVARAGQAPWKIALVSGASFFLALILLQLPLFFGYDGSIFTTWHGPGAASWSRPAPRLTGALGIAVSYRFVLEAILAPAFKLIFAAEAFVWNGVFESSWATTISVALVYALGASVLALVIARVTFAVRQRRGTNAV
jgi:hypothetical protein